MDRIKTAPPASLPRLEPAAWAALAAALPVALALASIVRGTVIAPVSWALLACGVGLAVLFGLALIQTDDDDGPPVAAAGVALATAVPATLLATVTGGLAGPAMAATFWPLVAGVALALPWRYAAGTAAAAFAASAAAGAATGPVLSPAGEMLGAEAYGWAGMVAVSLPAAFLIAALVLRSRRPAAPAATVSTDALEAARAEAEAARKDAAEAREASNARARFMAEMSHEIRNPLNAILGFSDTMRAGVMGPLPGPYADYPRLIHDSGSHLLGLVSDLLDLSKIEAGRFQVSAEPLRLDEAARDAVEMMAGAASQAKVRLRLVASGPVDAIGDERAVRQILLNLISNAIKFTPEFGQVQVGARPGTTPGTALIEVRDTGSGMTADELLHATELYASAGDQPRGARGTGLGLALVKRLSELQGGQFTLASTKGQGTSAIVMLPVAPVDGADDEPSAAQPDDTGSPATSGNATAPAERESKPGGAWFGFRPKAD